MIELVWDTGFKRSYKKRISIDNQLKEKFWDSLELFTTDPFDPRLQTHKLTGRLSGYWAFVIFMFIKAKKKVLLLDIGSHEEVY